MAEKKLSKEIIQKLFAENAKNAAKAVCGQGECIACYNCGHKNKTKGVMPKLGTAEKCPLEAYNVIPDTRTFIEKLKAGDLCRNTEENLEGLFALCACCEHAEVIEKESSYELSIDDRAYMLNCIDCPVRMARDDIQENMTEAAMS